ncbi:MAG: biotin/lipoyl-binding protein [Alistipes sp.]|jgi:biotin carboxyl carrier protein|nr:biotin/lipoyl-binding protein [Alistipes sp.]
MAKEYKFKINGHEYEVAVGSVESGAAKVTVNGTDYEVEVQSNTLIKPRPAKPVAVAPAVYSATAPVSPAKINQAAPAAGSTSTLKSPLPGVILDVKVREGDTVKAGQLLMVLEAMKMENNIDAHQAGVVKNINKRQGDSVLEGDVLLTIE